MPTARLIAARSAIATSLLLLGLVTCHGDDNDVCGPATIPCKTEGRCTLEGKNCAAKLDSGCAASDKCKYDGHCKAREGKCAAVDDADCEPTAYCKNRGNCKAEGGSCMVGSKEYCERRAECQGGLCDVAGGDCIVVRKPPKPGSGIGHGSGQGVGGCPCGCDHSEAMAVELATAPSDVARATIEETLEVIAEREDAGYITPAMIDHRRRMLALSGELYGDAQPVLGRGVALPIDAPFGARAVTARGGGLSARAELMVHGETTERVRGADKTIRASFVLALELQNQGQARRALTPPKLEGGAGFPVSSWYLLGSAGEPWDGVLEAGETRRVNAIGYLEQPLAPGSVAVAQVELAGLGFRVESLARAHWR